jgi:hypothetical protein
VQFFYEGIGLATSRDLPGSNHQIKFEFTLPIGTVVHEKA